MLSQFVDLSGSRDCTAQHVERNSVCRWYGYSSCIEQKAPCQPDGTAAICPHRDALITGSHSYRIPSGYLRLPQPYDVPRHHFQQGPLVTLPPQTWLSCNSLKYSESEMQARAELALAFTAQVLAAHVCIR